MAKDKSKRKQITTTPEEKPTKEEHKKQPPPTSKKPVDEISDIFSSTEEKQKKPPPSTSKKPVDEIDTIFSSTKKRKKPEQQRKKVEGEEGNRNDNQTKKVFTKVKNVRGSKDDLFGATPSRSRKKTSDGLAIYTEEELGINRTDAGSTSLCPFDCDCCF